MDSIDIDVDSVTWRSIRAWATDRLVTCRQRNDAALPMENTATLRGQISAWKELLALEVELPQPHDAERAQLVSYSHD